MMSDAELKALHDSMPETPARVMGMITELLALREESRWIRKKLDLPEDCGFVTGRTTLAGAMHVVCSEAFGYDKYVKAFKCDDKQGEIARLTVEVNELRRIIADINCGSQEIKIRKL